MLSPLPFLPEYWSFDMDMLNINDVIANIRLDAEREAMYAAERIMEQVAKKVERTEKNRLALMLLSSAGIGLSSYGDRHIYVSLGFFKNTKKGNAELAEKVKAIRNALGCRLEQAGKDVDDAKLKTVEFTLKPVDFDTVHIKFIRKLPKGAKCKIVRGASRYTSLVCTM